jgi:hypothetical protein
LEQAEKDRDEKVQKSITTRNADIEQAWTARTKAMECSWETFFLNRGYNGK